FVVSNSIPGKKLLGDWRFPPIFFVAGFLFEVVLCKLRINNINFYDVYKRKQAHEFVVKKHQLDDYLKTITLEASRKPTNALTFMIGSQTAHIWLNPMKDYKDFIQKAEADYQAQQQELAEVEEYLKKKREDRLKQIS
ncbi:unnamed protein product, partial [Adineta ricciae]